MRTTSRRLVWNAARKFGGIPERRYHTLLGQMRMISQNVDKGISVGEPAHDQLDRDSRTRNARFPAHHGWVNGDQRSFQEHRHIKTFRSK
jgi:hypothetical protein